MKLFYTDHFELPLPEKHRFPMAKYRLLRERVAASHLVESGELLVPQAASVEQLLLAHTADYVRRVMDGQLSAAEVRRMGFPWSPQLVERSRRSVGATIAAGRAALEDGVAANLAGGTHHAFADAGEGYCVFNDVAVAIRVLLSEGRIRRAVILDCDVHQGNGTASILNGDPAAFTFSMHGGRNFPFRKFPSNLDAAVPDGTGNDVYLRTLGVAIPLVLDLAQADLAFYLAGADPFENDRLGRLRLTQDGMAERDRLVLQACAERGLPVAVVMAGGYATNVDEIAGLHFQTLELAQAILGK